MPDTTTTKQYLSEIEKMMLLDKAIKETLSNIENLNKFNCIQILYLVLIKKLCNNVIPFVNSELTSSSKECADKIMKLYIAGLDVKYKGKSFKIDFSMQSFQDTYALGLKIKSFTFEKKEYFHSIEENINILNEEFIEKEKEKIKLMLDCIYNKTINFENFFNLLKKRVEIDE